MLKSTPKRYGFDNANKISSFNTTSGSANFIPSDDPRKKLKLPEYCKNIESVDNESSVFPSATQKVLVGDVSTVVEKSCNGKLPWMEEVGDEIRNNCNADKFSNTSWVAFLASNEQQIRKEIVDLPSFIEEAATPSIVKHCLTLILKTMSTKVLEIFHGKQMISHCFRFSK